MLRSFWYTQSWVESKVAKSPCASEVRTRHKKKTKETTLVSLIPNGQKGAQCLYTFFCEKHVFVRNSRRRNSFLYANARWLKALVGAASNDLSISCLSISYLSDPDTRSRHLLKCPGPIPMLQRCVRRCMRASERSSSRIFRGDVQMSKVLHLLR